MSDEGVHEIQLNGKQLVFMFMAVTVVAVVIFLCGVMVGRGVRAPRATELADVATQSPVDPTADVAPAPPSADGPSSPATSDPTQDPTLASGRLNTTTPPPETPKEVPLIQEVNASAPAAVKKSAAEPPPAPKAAAPKEPPPKFPAVSAMRKGAFTMP